MNPDIEKAIAAIRSQGGTDADVEAYVRSLGAKEVSPADSAITDLNAASERSARASAREAQSAEERKLTGPQRVGAAAQNALGMASWGVSNLAGDAIDAMFSDRTFAANRQARRMTNEATPTPERVAAMVGGALLNPVGAVVKAPATAGFLARTGAVAADAALQGGGTAAVEAFDEASPAGLLRAGRAGLAGATNAVAGTAGFRTGVSLARGANTLRRATRAEPLDVRRWQMQDAMRATDDANFGRVRGEATGPTTQEVSRVLNTQTVAPFAKVVRESEEFAGANDNIILLEAYKRMSEAQRKSLRAQEGTAELLAGIAQKGRDIGLAKGRMLDAADPSIPSLRPANAAHAEARASIEAFEDVSSSVQRIMRKASQKDEKILLDSPEALRRAIAEMTPAQAEAAIDATLGRARESWKLSSNMLTGFGVPGAVVRTAIMPHQINPYLRLLEKQAGRKPSVFDNPVIMGRGLGAFSRTAGGMTGLLAPR